MTLPEQRIAEIKERVANATSAQVTLTECPVGLFYRGDNLCLKSEYGNNEGRIDAYIVSSGEFFWGEAPQTIASQREQLVEPFDEDFITHARQDIPDLIAERDELIASRDLSNELAAQAISDLSIAHAEIERLRAALENLESDARQPQILYDKNGPQWTHQNSEFYDASYFLDKCNEIADTARAALGGNHE